MGSKSWEDLWWVSYVVLAVWIVNGFLIMYLLNQIDSIVNVQLYAYGLQFSNQWADSYWGSSRLMLVFLGVPMALSAAVFVAGFRRFRKKANTILGKRKAEQPQVEPPQVEAPQVPSEEKPLVENPTATPEQQELNPEVECEPEPEQEPEPVCEPQLEVIQPEEIQVEQDNREAEAVESVEEPHAKEDMGLLISCPNCSKVFNRPLVMLDFSSGTTRLVSICPFCNHILGETVDSKKNDEEAQ